MRSRLQGVDVKGCNDAAGGLFGGGAFKEPLDARVHQHLFQPALSSTGLFVCLVC